MNITEISSMIRTDVLSGSPTFFFGLVMGILFIIISIPICLTLLKGGKSKMAGKKKDKKSKKSEAIQDELGGDYLAELDDIENGSDEEDIEEPTEGNEVLEKFEALENKLEKYENGIAVNQKYIKKIWQRVKELEDNFNILIQQK